MANDGCVIESAKRKTDGAKDTIVVYARSIKTHSSNMHMNWWACGLNACIHIYEKCIRNCRRYYKECIDDKSLAPLKMSNTQNGLANKMQIISLYMPNAD